MEYVHYGSNHFNKELFKPIMNKPLGVKPNGGLWASPCNSEYGWRQWCEIHKPQWITKDHFYFTLKDGARVLNITSLSDVKPQMKIANNNLPLPNFTTWICLDFEKLAKDYDAIYMEVNSELYFPFYGWDCDSLLVMNPKVIIIEE